MILIEFSKEIVLVGTIECGTWAYFKWNLFYLFLFFSENVKRNFDMPQIDPNIFPCTLVHFNRLFRLISGARPNFDKYFGGLV